MADWRIHMEILWVKGSTYINIKLTIYYECTLTEFEDIGAFRMPFFGVHLDANKYTDETKN